MNERQIDSWCIMCGAAPNEPCTIIDPVIKGQVRESMHFYRGGRYEKPTVLVPDEPPWNDPNHVAVF